MKPSTVLIFGFSGVLARWVVIGAGRAAPAVWHGFLLFIFGFDNGALSLPIGSDKKAVRHECGTAGCGVKVCAGDFGAKCSVSESSDGCPLRLRGRVVGGVMAAGHDQAQQRGGHVRGFGNEPAQSLNGVTANLTAYL